MYLAKIDFSAMEKYFDVFYGVPGFNGLLRRRFLEMIRKISKNRPYFSNTTYAIMYRLIEDKKVGLFFTPKLRIPNFFSSNTKAISVVGGYDFNTRRINIFVEWKFGADVTNDIINSNLSKVMQSVFAIILSEALMIYNYNTNGSIINHEIIRNWYESYFELTMTEVTGHSKTSVDMASMVKDKYPSIIYNKVEKLIIEGRSPSIKVETKGNNPDLDIEGIPSIRKGDKVLNKVFGDVIEDILADNASNLGMDAATYDTFKEFAENYGEFCSFVFKNRDLTLNLKNLEEVPDLKPNNTLTTDAATVSYSSSIRRDDRQGRKELMDSIKKDPTKRDTMDRIIKDEVAGVIGKVPSTAGALTPGDTYIGKYLLPNKNVTLKDLSYAIDAVSNAYNVYDSIYKGIDKITDNDKKKDALKALEVQGRAASALYQDLYKLFQVVTSNTQSENHFYHTDSPVRKSVKDINYANIAGTLKLMRDLVEQQKKYKVDPNQTTVTGILVSDRDKQVRLTAGRIAQLTDKLKSISDTSVMRDDDAKSAYLKQEATKTYVELASLLTDKAPMKLSRQEIRQKQQIIDQNQDILNKVKYLLPEKVHSDIRKAFRSNIDVSSKESLDLVLKNIVLADGYTTRVANTLDDNNPDKRRLLRDSRVSAGGVENLSNYVDNLTKRFIQRDRRYNIATDDEKRAIEKRYKEIAVMHIRDAALDRFNLSKNTNANNARAALIRHPQTREFLEDLYQRGIIRSRDTVNNPRRMTVNDMIKITDLIRKEKLDAQASIMKSKNQSSVVFDAELIDGRAPSERQIRSLVNAANTVLKSYVATNTSQPILHVVDERKIPIDEQRERSLFRTGISALLTIFKSAPGFMDMLKFVWSSRKDAKILYNNVKVAMQYFKMMLPLKSNIKGFFDGSKLGFGPIARMEFFDLSYKISTNVKKMYELKKGTCRDNMIYSELFFPSSILVKYLYATLTTTSDYDSNILQLLNYSNKGLESFIK